MQKRSVTELLQARPSEQLGWPLALPVQTYAGKRQLDQVCWSWVTREGIKTEASSIFTMTECLAAKADKITWHKASSRWDVSPAN